MSITRQVETFPDLSLAPLRTDGLDDRDAALAHAIYDAVLRRWFTLSFIIDSALTRPMETMKPSARAALLGGAAQLLLLDRIPHHAAIHETVEWAKGHTAGGLVRMINGVLRNISRLVAEGRRREVFTGARDELPLGTGGAVVLARHILPADETVRWAVATGCPESLLRHWSAEWGEEEAKRQAMHTLTPPPTVVNATYASVPTDADLSPHEDRGMYVWTGGRTALLSLLDTRANLWVQDSSSARAVATAREVIGDVGDGAILDLCAGQGTKTRQLAAAFPKATIIGTDVDPRRRESLRALAGRLSRIQVVEPEEISRWAGRAAAVLLDVPCSNSGVLARRPEAKYRWGSIQAARLGAIQRDIITQSVGMIRPGGWVVYSTCSTDRCEDEEVTRWADGLGLRMVKEDRCMPNGLPGEPDGRYRDGSYVAVLRKEQAR